MNIKWILADWHFFSAFAEKMFQVYPQPAGNLNVSKRQKDTQYGKIYMVQWIFFPHRVWAQWDSTGIFYFFSLAFFSSKRGKLLVGIPFRGHQPNMQVPVHSLSLPVSSLVSVSSPPSKWCCSEQSLHNLQENSLFISYCPGNQFG